MAMKKELPPFMVDGKWTKWPITREDAIRLDVAKYRPIPYQTCDVCGEPAPIFTLTGICSMCARIEALRAYNGAIAAGEPVSATEALQMGIGYYFKQTPGKYCGHIGATLLNGRCAYCESEKKESPRQQAISRGDVWYQPLVGDLCSNGHNAPRRVSNGSCKKCEQLKARPSKPIWKLHPDMVISRSDATAMGLKAYRTGEPCRRGHKSWRYVSNGGCLECIGKI